MPWRGFGLWFVGFCASLWRDDRTQARDVARAARFYEGAFGWPAGVDVPVYRELVLPDGTELKNGLKVRVVGTRTGNDPVNARIIVVEHEND